MLPNFPVPTRPFLHPKFQILLRVSFREGENQKLSGRLRLSPSQHSFCFAGIIQKGLHCLFQGVLILFLCSHTIPYSFHLVLHTLQDITEISLSPRGSSYVLKLCGVPGYPTLGLSPPNHKGRVPQDKLFFCTAE